MAYFEVVAKGGHVGKDFYYECFFYLSCETASEASKAVLKYPRVKKDHSDAILRCSKITLEEYEAGLEKVRDEPYFFVQSYQEQKLYWNDVKKNIRPETKMQAEYREQRYNSTKYRKKPEPETKPYYYGKTLVRNIKKWHKKYGYN